MLDETGKSWFVLRFKTKMSANKKMNEDDYTSVLTLMDWWLVMKSAESAATESL